MRNEKGVRARALFVEKDAVGVCIAPDRVMMDGRTDGATAAEGMSLSWPFIYERMSERDRSIEGSGKP